MIYNVCNGILLYFFAGDWGDGFSNPCKEQFEVIIDLRGCTDGGAWIFCCYFLLYGNGWSNSFYVIDLRFFHST